MEDNNENENIEVERVIYDPIAFPKIHCFDTTKKLTIEDLNIPFFYCQFYRNSDERFELNEEKFDQTLTDILSTNDEILIIRSVILIFLMKNIFDVTYIFKRIVLKEDFQNGQHRIFNELFFNELQNNQILILDTIEIIQSFIQKYSLNNELLYSFIIKIIESNESSPNPVETNQMNFYDETKIEKENEIEIERKYPLILPFSMKYRKYCEHEPNMQTIEIHVNRDKVLESVWHLDDMTNFFNAKIKTIFGEGENDEGGPTREFIELSFKEIVNKENGLFELRKGNNYWFEYQRTITDELKKKYRSIGILFGLSILNRLTIPIHFPRYFYKKLLHRKICLNDMNLYDPQIFNTLTYVLNHNCKEEDMLDFSFVNYEKNYEIDLNDFSYVKDSNNFQPKPLVDSNKKEYVSKIIEWIFDISIKDQFESFEEGFQKVNTNSMIFQNFTLGEIDKLISGDRVIDWDSLKKNAKYLNGYSADSQVIKWFWNYFDSLNEDKKFEALRFITGSSSVPTGGLKDVHIRFLKTNDDEKLPIAHTCFSQIDLPEFKSYEELENGCKEAFPNMRFGFS